jgi:drug/metabolite transporter (DMT)-like permease
VRVLGRTDTTGSMMFWFTAIVGLGAGMLAAPGWVPVRPEHWPVLAFVAVNGALGQYAVTEAFRRGEASVVAPFEYTAIGMGVTLDWVLWSTRPQPRMLAGAGIVIAAGLYLIHRERSRPRLEAEHP